LIENVAPQRTQRTLNSLCPLCLCGALFCAVPARGYANVSHCSRNVYYKAATHANVQVPVRAALGSPTRYTFANKERP